MAARMFHLRGGVKVWVDDTRDGVEISAQMGILPAQRMILDPGSATMLAEEMLKAAARAMRSGGTHVGAS